MEGVPSFTRSRTLPDVPYAQFAELLGLHGIAVDHPDDVGPAWERALAADRPTVLDVRVDPDVPPIPRQATFEQALNSAKAVIKGDQNAWGFIMKGVKTKLEEFLPHKDS